MSHGKKDILLILHNIRSVHNVGSIFRTADGAGVEKLYLVGHTPTPIDRFGRARKDLAKVALGAEVSVSWEYHKTISPLIRKLRKEGVGVVAVEQDERSVNYKTFKTKKPVALILGNEVTGIPKKVLALCDAIVEIPMRGKKESLNVSVVAGIVLFELV
ncbi:MAG: TrmH family RNA methyltransferase [bacterium]|nr:TrmH family RNA methyltransferase [bacterium]